MDPNYRNFLMRRRKKAARSGFLPLLPQLINNALINRARNSGIKRRKSRKGVLPLLPILATLGGIGAISKIGNSIFNRKSGKKKITKGKMAKQILKNMVKRKKRFNIRNRRFNIRKGDLDADFLGEFGGLSDDVITPPTQSTLRQGLNWAKKLFKSKNSKNLLKKIGGTAQKTLLKKIDNMSAKDAEKAVKEAVKGANSASAVNTIMELSGAYPRLSRFTIRKRKL